MVRNDSLPLTSRGFLRIRSEHGLKPRVSVVLSAQEVSLNFSSDPVPPEPAADVTLATASRKRHAGLKEIGRKFFEELKQQKSSTKKQELNTED